MVLKVQARDYQKKIYETALYHNTLVVLPTGLGKTLIALMLSVKRLQEHPGKKVLLVAPTKPLVEQHAKSFKAEIPELFADVQVLTGESNATLRAKTWNTADIIIATPQSIANDLEKYLYTLEDVCLVIIDEAHRCLKNYDYTKIVQRYKSTSPTQRILGLTASPGSNIDNVREICNHLDVEEIEIRNRESLDVKPYLQEREHDKIEVPFPPEFEELRFFLRKIYDMKVDQLRERSLLFGPANKITLLKLQQRLAMQASQKNGNAMYGMSLTAQAIKISHAVELLETQTLSGLKAYLDGLLEQANNKQTKAAENLVKMPEFNGAYISVNNLLAQKKEHPKITAIVQLVKETLKEKANGKIIVFTQFRESASQISLQLNSIENVKAKIFIGQTKKKDMGMSQKEQKQILDQFRSGDINVLCATSIGEEGLDIPEVDMVVFYEPIPSAIRKIQRAGRTARLAPGKIVMLITKDTKDEANNYASTAREKKMYSIIEKVKQEISKKSISLSRFSPKSV
ncbi:MAG TPA: DEAD/DEAH box helicase [Candidatus Nanoarchaeia archaeon]|nr:DEAD/DEAH box helicase [Candidatus Nanoarchaeia archaeon]